ncbi:GNAT family N-acetyltransferase [Vibrio crassostreae]|uniref:GNAT family N-acetyltransferase n=1 Tax=Vibrio crassostreae TaxID=246167 RepID=UPI000F496B30|nr:GNAT family protein [Vibrio crassostreae]ROO56696.1 RimJ/RimL family protein N-acetyltransferase [Vibrio crassostreae]ROO57912.1 RimJ/RimL family protein N-acetyltransferase [Vibrio crassostreae]ROO74256.1 RimJ/RimL family protein N-acetyltransferase [Vibrio crassostreae]ROO76817.1 RimJ/RimL family protein N-acetyltransferase [Vibrio crassostreae]ROR70459.1 RimJ/RimL family protein N-acetyltransferase [Vibrio crassostreae]
MFKLETDRLILRDMDLEDECAFVAMSQDAKYQRFYDESDCEPSKYRELTQLFVTQAAEVPRKSYQLAVESKHSGKFIGTVCLRLERDKQASMGCAFSRETQGKGLSIEASEALADFGFSELGIHRIYAETISKNLAAIKLCKVLEMRQEAYFKQHRFFKGKWWDTVVLAVLRSEWQKI